MSFGSIWMRLTSMFSVNLVPLCFMVLMTSVTGSITFGLWKWGSRFLERRGNFRGIRAGLILVILSFLVPFWFLYKTFCLRLLFGGNAGPLFRDTPVLVTAGKLLFSVWLGGALWRIAQIYQKRWTLRRLLRGSRPAGGEIQKIADRIQKDFHIRRRIPVYLTEAGIGPMITGAWNSRIYLPERPYEKEELEMILEHELRHYKQGDLVFKEMCSQITWIHWFHPSTEELYQAVNQWGEFHCDLWLCNEAIHSWDRKQYFLTILKYTPEQAAWSFSRTGLGKTAEEIRSRMEAMKYYDSKKEWSRAVLACLGICFVLTSSVTSLAAGKTLEKCYQAVYDETEVIEYEEILPQPELSGESTTAYRLTIPANGINKYGNFYMERGSRLEVAIVSDQPDSNTKFELKSSKGKTRGILGSGSYRYSFIISESGTYRAYVRDEDGR